MENSQGFLNTPGGGKKKSGSFKIFIVGLLVGAILSSVLSYYFLGKRLEAYINNRLQNVSSSYSTEPIVASKDEDATATQTVATAVTPAVVGIEAVEVTSDMFNRQYESTGVGTGFIVTANGLILTNQHVVSENPKTLTVTLKNGKSYQAKVLFASSDLDIAIIKIDAKDLPTVSLGDSDGIQVGQSAIAIGNPLGLTFERSVTKGIISALNRSIPLETGQIAEDLIQTDASINSGNSGGPLLNSEGQVVGINTYKVSTGEGMGFAIPINVVKPILDHVIQDGYFVPPLLGITGVDRQIARYVTEETIDLEYGILITDIDASYGAYKAGMRTGDIITKVAGVEVNTMLQMKAQLFKRDIGESIEITYERNSKEQTVKVKLMQ